MQTITSYSVSINVEISYDTEHTAMSCESVTMEDHARPKSTDDNVVTMI